MEVDPENYLSQSLDDLIKAKKKGGGKRGGGPERSGGKEKDENMTGTGKTQGRGRGRGRGGGGARRGARGRREAFHTTNPGDVDGEWKHDMYDGPVLGVNEKKSSGPVRGKGGRGGGRVGRAARAAATAPYEAKGGTDGGILSRLGDISTVPKGTPVTVSRLNRDVEESEVFDLFSTVGPMVDVSMQYDQKGKSTGAAVVTFEDPVNAGRAVERFHNRTLDGIPMSVKLGRHIGSSKATAAAPRQVGASKDGKQTRHPRMKGVRALPMALAAAEAAAASTSGGGPSSSSNITGGRRGRGGGRRRGGGRGGRVKNVSSSMDLDAELEDYHTVNNQI